MTEDAGQIFKGLINEYKGKAERSDQQQAGMPIPPGLGAFWLDSETGILYIASVGDDGEALWRRMEDVMGPKPLKPLSADDPDQFWI
jgi:hypothetical protein